MTDSLEVGIPGLGLEPGDHICALYHGPAERDKLMFPYLRAGLRAGDKCICIADSPDVSAVRAGVGDGMDVDHCISLEQLQLLTWADSYLRTGRFSTEEMIKFWDESVGAAISSGRFRFARAVGEMSWALRNLPKVEELIGYESELNRFLPRYPQWFMCLYDLETFGGAILVDLLRTHPKLLLGGMLLENPHYLSPDEFLAQRR